MEQYLPYLNAALAGLLVIAGWALEAKRGSEVVWFGFGFLPAVVYGVVIAAKTIMGSVDVGELEGLKYRYKGA